MRPRAFQTALAAVWGVLPLGLVLRVRWLRERCSLGHFVGQDFLLIRFIFMSEYKRGPRGRAKFIFGAPMGPPMFKSPAHQGTWGPRATEIYTGPWVPEADGTKTRMPQAALTGFGDAQLNVIENPVRSYIFMGVFSHSAHTTSYLTIISPR